MNPELIELAINLFIGLSFFTMLTGLYMFHNNMELVDFLKIYDNYRYEMYYVIPLLGYPPAQIDSFYKIWNYLKDDGDYTYEEERILKNRLNDSIRLFLLSVLVTFSIGFLIIIFTKF